MTIDPHAARLLADALTGRITAALDRGATVRLAVAAAIAAEFGEDHPEDKAPRESAWQRLQRENADALAQMAELERQGNRRGAAAVVARRIAVNKRDPAEIETIAQRLRRLRRKKTSTCSDAA